MGVHTFLKFLHLSELEKSISVLGGSPQCWGPVGLEVGPVSPWGLCIQDEMQVLFLSPFPRLSRRNVGRDGWGSGGNS